jgi:hypothetical protein
MTAIDTASHEGEKWTKGPWRIGKRHADGSFAIHAQDSSVVHCKPFSSSMKSWGANAHLIAAAPTMFQELLDTDDALTKLINDLCNFVDKPSMAIVEEWQRSVRVTIAKARGDRP